MENDEPPPQAWIVWRRDPNTGTVAASAAFIDRRLAKRYAAENRDMILDDNPITLRIGVLRE